MSKQLRRKISGPIQNIEYAHNLVISQILRIDECAGMTLVITSPAHFCLKRTLDADVVSLSEPFPTDPSFIRPDSSRPSSPNRPPFKLHNDFYNSKGLWNDIKTLRWMRVPCKSS